MGGVGTSNPSKQGSKDPGPHLTSLPGQDIECYRLCFGQTM